MNATLSSFFFFLSRYSKFNYSNYLEKKMKSHNRRLVQSCAMLNFGKPLQLEKKNFGPLSASCPPFVAKKINHNLMYLMYML